MSKAVITFGRMNPITVGHQKVVDKVKAEAKKQGAKPYVYLSHSQDKKKNPLDYDTKLKSARKAFGPSVTRSRARTIIEVMVELQKKHKEVTVIVGSDRVREFKTLLNKYNGKDFTYDKIDVVSAGERDPDAEGAAGMSATKMRTAAQSGDYKSFKKGTPRSLSDRDVKAMYDKIRSEMGTVKEEIEWSDEDFEFTDAELDAAVEMMDFDRLDEDQEIDEEFGEYLDEVRKPLTIAQRMKIGRRMKRLAPRMARMRKIRSKRMADPKRLERRARKAAIRILRKRFAGKQGQNYAKLSPGSKMSVDRIVQKKASVIPRLAKRLLPKMRKAEMERLKRARGGKSAKLTKAAQTLQVQGDHVEPHVPILYEEEVDTKLMALLRVTFPDSSERNLVVRALRGGSKSLQNPSLRPYLMNILLRLLDGVQDDPSIYNKVKEKMRRLGLEEKQDPDIKDRKGSQPASYHSGLKKNTKVARDRHFKKYAEKPGEDKKDSDANYKPAPGDAKGKTKLSKHTKKYKAMYGEEKMECPPATKDVALNTKNRNATRENHMYGPLNVKEPGDYWEKLADKWDTTVEAAKKSKCGSCVAFDISPRMEECMPGSVSDESGRLGYCWMHHFKCHSARSCDTWATGGPIKEDKKSYEWQEKAFGKKEDINTAFEEIFLKEEVLTEKQIEGLKKKSEKSGIPYGILKQVYNRGMAAWKSGHRPGTTPQQWAFARVNSFITKGSGTWGKADKDLAAKARGSKKEELELDESLENRILALLKTKMIPAKFVNGKLVVDKSDMRAAHRAIKQFRDIKRIPSIIGEDAVKAAKDRIKQEKEADKAKHDAILDRARLQKAQNKNRATESLDDQFESLWANIHKKRKDGRPMRKKGEKGAPTDDAFSRAKNESVSEDTAVDRMLSTSNAKQLMIAYKKLYRREYPGTSKSELIAKIKAKAPTYRAAYAAMNEEYGAGEEGTGGLVKKYKEDTPGEDCTCFDHVISEAEYQGRKVKLNDPMRSNDGKKKFYVYAKNEKGNIVKVGFGDPNMEIKRDDPGRRKNFRARHNCDNPGPKWKARYWSCYQWRAGAKVDN